MVDMVLSNQRKKEIQPKAARRSKRKLINQIILSGLALSNRALIHTRGLMNFGVKQHRASKVELRVKLIGDLST